jgi:hypothetical protein
MKGIFSFKPSTNQKADIKSALVTNKN